MINIDDLSFPLPDDVQIQLYDEYINLRGITEDYSSFMASIEPTEEELEVASRYVPECPPAMVLIKRQDRLQGMIKARAEREYKEAINRREKLSDVLNKDYHSRAVKTKRTYKSIDYDTEPIAIYHS